MDHRSQRVLLALFVFVVAPAGAVVMVSVLLLFGVHPRVVFAPGWALMHQMQAIGVRAPNAVGVASTVGLWWLLIVAIGLAWEKKRNRSAMR